MDLTIRDWMVIIGVLLIVAVGLDAWRRVRKERYPRVKMKLAENPGSEAEAEPEVDVDIAWLKELPNGGARVVERGDLIKAAQARPFIETASRLGVPVNTLARQAGLPLTSVRKGEGVIGEYSIWRFVELASNYPGCEHLGYLTALDHPISHTGQLGGMAITHAHSLEEVLEILFREIVNESDSCDYRLASQGGKTWFTRELIITAVADGWQPPGGE